ncbi:MAG TPA: TetR/AcrR family transcriptional regulator [Chryseolinea sp.]|jgi:AcrR family transcriptional regulator|nr:TetR/AcrR family transcriptional regulator [Chryseolinea sp.]
MSKTLIRTEERIVAKALEMFNEKGIEYVGMRELAASLGIRVSNITYYFPTKDDLVNRLSLDFSALNSRVIVANSATTMKSFLEMFHQVFLNHVTYRCLLLSFVHLMERNKPMALRYNKIQGERHSTLMANLTMLVNRDYLKLRDEGDGEILVSSIRLISRFWISDAAISLRQLNIDQQIRHYLIILVRLLSPYATSKGKKELEAFVKGLT